MAAHKRYNTSAERAAAHKLSMRKWVRSPKGRAWIKRHNVNPKCKAAKRLWQMRHPGNVNANTWRYRARKRNCLTGNLKKIAKIYGRAAELRALGFDVQVDHRLPLSRGGEHHENNLRIIWTVDNHSKNCRLDYPDCFEFPL
jgi:5-methylcytosine-specific restriction endonuclease McrA